jgi:membrane protease YdiL (CAAX protease family)
MSAGETPSQDAADIPQYGLAKTLLVWAAAAAPMAILGWVAAPALQQDPGRPGFERVAVLALGLIWQFALVLILIRLEAGNLRWSTIRQRLWLNTPRSPTTGQRRAGLWWWLIPVVLLTALYQMQVRGLIDRAWISVFPFLTQPAGFDLGGLLGDPAARARLEGEWWVLALFIASAVFNTVLGEELLFRGLAQIGWLGQRPEIDATKYIRGAIERVCVQCESVELAV